MEKYFSKIISPDIEVRISKSLVYTFSKNKFVSIFPAVSYYFPRKTPRGNYLIEINSLDILYPLYEYHTV